MPVGRQLQAGSRLPVTASIVLNVGEGVSDDIDTTADLETEQF